MAEYPDLSPYCYYESQYRPRTLNVGWISASGRFPKAVPTDEFAERLLAYTRVSVVQMRGRHYCDGCPHEKQLAGFGPKGDFLLLGMAEIRVFARDGTIFAAPNLLYHYVTEHSYAPPTQFVMAVMEMPLPPDGQYFEMLRTHALDWMETWRSKSQGT